MSVNAVRQAADASPFDRTLVSVLQRHAAAQPDQLAYVFVPDGQGAETSITFGQLDRWARMFARRLLQNARTGDRAALLYRPGLDFIAAFLGCLYAKIIAVPMYLPVHARHMGKPMTVLEDAQIRLALTTASDLAQMRALFENAEGAPAGRRGPPLTWVSSDCDLAAGSGDDFWPSVDPQDLAFLQYTSGSTGAPKGVMVTHANLISNERMVEAAFGHSSRTVFAGWLPLFHDMGLIGNVLQPLYLGVACHLISPVAFQQKPVRWLQLISRYRATTSGAPNFAYDLCARRVTQAQRAELDLSSWEVAFCGAEPVRAETLDRFAAAFEPCGFRREAFYPCYGMAEATLFACGGHPASPPVRVHVDKDGLERGEVRIVAHADAATRTLVGCGHAWLGQTIRVVDPETRVPCAAGRVGEIWVNGPCVAQGYWNRGEETQRTFGAQLATGDGHSFLRTGDLGFEHAGDVFITGRLKDLIIVRGRNHAPEDIELTVSRVHPALRLGTGAAFSVEVDGDERLVVVQEVEREYLHALDIDELTGDLREAVVAGHGLAPHALVLVKTASIPKTSSGKVQRQQTKRRFLEGSLAVIVPRPARGQEQPSLATTD